MAAGWEFSFLEAMASIRNDFLNSVGKVLTFMGDHGVFWIALCLVLIIIPKTRKIGIYAVAALAIQFLLGEGILKPLIQRDRPFIQHPDIDTIIPHPSGYSFPSGHTSSGISVALSVFLQNKKLGAPLLVIAVLIMISRLYFNVHFLTDVLAGIVLGVVTAIVIYYTFNYLHKKMIEDLSEK